MIDDTTIKTEATKLREELKRGRQRQHDTSNSGTTEDHGRHDQNFNGEARSSLSVLQRTGTTDGRRTRTVRSDGRSTIRSDGRVQGQSEQSRPGGRRPYEQHPGFITGGTADATEGARRSVERTLGNFERQDDVPRRDVTNEENPQPPYTPREKRSPGRPKKVTLEPIPTEILKQKERAEQQEFEHSKSVFQSVKDFIPTGKTRSVLNEAEVRNFSPILKGALKDYGRYTDQYLNYRLPTAGTIWGNLDTDELDSLVSALLSIGKRNGTVAEGVRLVAHSNDYLTTVMILIPRLMQTTQVLQQAPPKARKTASERGERFRNRFRSRLGEKVV